LAPLEVRQEICSRRSTGVPVLRRLLYFEHHDFMAQLRL